MFPSPTSCQGASPRAIWEEVLVKDINPSSTVRDPLLSGPSILYLSANEAVKMPSFASPLFLLTLLHHVQAQKIWPILSNPTFGWTPNITNAVRDDILEFHFLALNHSVVAGDLNGKACTPAKDGGFYSGFYPVSDGENVRSFLPPLGPSP